MFGYCQFEEIEPAHHAFLPLPLVEGERIKVRGTRYERQRG
jgi:hypothetical protein